MEVNGIKFTIGADPEIFVARNNTVISAHGLVQGTKINPFKVDKGAIQVDGMALEFNIDPADCPDTFVSNLNAVKDQLASMIGDAAFVEEVSNYFDANYMASQPAAAVELGCDPDYNGWTYDENRKPDADGTLRTVGGHVHVGGFHTKNPYLPGHFKTSGRLARIMDEQLGVYSILWDRDDHRRSLYGQAGSFRPKSYGMEYRTMSNRWIFSEKITRFVYDAVRDSLELMFDKDYEPNPEVRDIINNSDRDNSFFRNNTKADFVMSQLA